MNILNLTKQIKLYTSNAYLIPGSPNSEQSPNTLIDVGNDPAVLKTITEICTAAGKPPVEQVILTHSHSDHTGLLQEIVKTYHPLVYAYFRSEYVNRHVTNGAMVRAGESFLEVIHTPGHSSDSICLYRAEEKIIFSGDTPLTINTAGGTYEEEFVTALKKLASLDIRFINPGHGEIIPNANRVIAETLKNVRNSTITRK